ncbi:MAG: UDP-N-acetylmuramate--L-alanine ligase [Proteobacteria bacterium]|nr:UDP-N-acetylmuramate--L-alanine ligase [Pseudomonadota bacterium]MDA1331094.1 UDP-N-acetylmuramate--L-alanine ligase [Pseudomonadota bacterium]
MKYKVKSIHFVGIGGVGMSGIAEVLSNLGYVVSGSDLRESPAVIRLRALGIVIVIGHSLENVSNVDVLVTSSAIDTQNPEVIEAKRRRIPVVPRAMMLAELMRFKQGIAIAGTHGKTTTTSLVASVLAESGMDPTYVIGGRLASAGTNARLGEGDFIVVEADESDASFLLLQPVICVVTNIDRDHLEAYDHDYERLKQAFLDFISRIPFYGTAVLCLDDPGIKEILPGLSRHFITYGFDREAQIRSGVPKRVDGKMCFTVERNLGPKLYPPLKIRLNCLGHHNVLNSLAAIALATELGVSDDVICLALESFQGVGRRMESYGSLTINEKEVTLYDDYGHHPNEVEPTLAAIREAYPNNRLVLVFQPHRYTRTRDCFDDFVRVLSKADVLILTDIYAAGELPIVGVDSSGIARSIRMFSDLNPVCVPGVEDAGQLLVELVEDGDLVITMGAGTIGSLAASIVANSERLKCVQRSET